MKQSIFMETTAIPPEKTAGEILTLLVSTGARQVSMDYDPAGKLSGLRFVLVIDGAPMMFRLPARTKPVFDCLWKRGYDKAAYKQNFDTKQRRADLAVQSERIAWRQLLRWVEAQMAMIQTGMSSADEVFLPYHQDNNGRTVYEIFTEQRLRALPPPSEKDSK